MLCQVLHGEQFTLIFQREETLILILGEIPVLACCKNHGAIKVNPVWGMQNLRYQGCQVYVLSGMRRVRA